jgi:hypothetical protein
MEFEAVNASSSFSNVGCALTCGGGVQSYDQVDTTAGKVVSLFGALVPLKCRSAALQLVCQSYFPACQITATGLSGTPHLP